MIELTIIAMLSYSQWYLIESSRHAMPMCLTFATPLTSKF